MDAVSKPRRPWWRKKRWIAAALLWLVVAYPLSLALVEAALPESRVTAEALAAVRVGMSQPEVNRLLAGEPDYEGLVTGRLTENDGFTFGTPGDGRKYVFRQWNSPERTAVVLFDPGGRVVCRYESIGQGVPLPHRLRRLHSGPTPIP